MGKCRKTIPIWVYFIVLLFFLLFFRNSAMQAVTTGITQCIQIVIPALFPFFIVVNLILATDLPDLLAAACANTMCRLFHCNAYAATAVLISLLGGYPIGAKTAAALYLQGKLTKAEAERLLAFCNNTGPAIFFGFLGGMLFPGVLLPFLLYGIHILSALLTGILLRPSQSPIFSSASVRKPARQLQFPAAVRSAFASTGTICAFVLAFGVAIALIKALIILIFPAFQNNTLLFSLFSGFLDMTNGIQSLGKLSSLPLCFVLASMYVNWGGICIHMQTKAVVEEAKLSLHWHMQGKIMQTVFAGLLSISPCLFLWGKQLPALLIGLVQVSAILILIARKRKTTIAISPPTRYNTPKATAI